MGGAGGGRAAQHQRRGRRPRGGAGRARRRRRAGPGGGGRGGGRGARARLRAAQARRLPGRGRRLHGRAGAAAGALQGAVQPGVLVRQGARPARQRAGGVRLRRSALYLQPCSTPAASDCAAARCSCERGAQLGQWAKAEEDYTRALAVVPRSSFALYNRGRGPVAACLDSSACVVVCVLCFLALRGTQWRQQGKRGWVARIARDRLGSYSAAVQDFSAAIMLDPCNADFYHNRGFSQRKQARAAARTAACCPLGRSVPHAAHGGLPAAHHQPDLHEQSACQAATDAAAGGRQGRFETAVSDYSAAIQHDRRHCRAYYNRAFANDRLGRFDLAVRLLSGTMTGVPMRTLAAAPCPARSLRAQVSDYSRALELDPQNATAYHNRGARPPLRRPGGSRDHARTPAAAPCPPRA
jgi:tetratricopeptide (TPR) repeat protein